MAKAGKKKAAKRPSTKKPTSGSASRSAKPQKGQRAQKRAKPMGARSQPLPGMETVKHPILRNICEGIADERATMNAAATEEKQLISTALQYMESKGVPLFKDCGVELTLVPGSNRLRVRLVKDQGALAVEGGTVSRGNAEPDEEVEFEPEAEEEPNTDSPIDIH